MSSKKWQLADDGTRGETIQFAIAGSSLGPVLVAASGKGICAVFMGDDPADLAGELRRRFPKADLQAGDEAFGQRVARVIVHIENPGLDWDLPLDLRGTAFQQRVWQALREIPAGTTTDYTRIAEKIGRSNAGRAVAGACGSNPVAVAVPCHRVVRTDGGLSGYRWGVERKRALLEREAKA
jgi:AraC family transcriptional regulator of adaptative response/methylated-DNA-[protein]-cysteine methyltransferase